MYRCLPSLVVPSSHYIWMQVRKTQVWSAASLVFASLTSQARSHTDPRNDDLKLFVPTITLSVACHGKTLTMNSNMQAIFRAQHDLSIEHSMVKNEELKLIGRWSWKSKNTSKTPTEDYMHHAMTMLMFKHKQLIVQTSCNTLVLVVNAHELTGYKNSRWNFWISNSHPHKTNVELTHKIVGQCNSKEHVSLGTP